MAGTRYSTSTVFIIGACMSLATACWTGITQTASYIWRVVCEMPAVFKEPRLEHPAPLKQIVQACAYATKLAKRDRPLTFGTWRMCPSA